MSVKSATAQINGVTYTLELGEDGLYHAVVPAPQADNANLVEYRSYPVTLTADDTAGNITVKDKDDPELGGALRLVVKEDIFIITKSWKPSDFFNTADYNRIKNNICYIKQIADIIYGSVEFANMGPDKTWEEYPAPSEFRLMEMNLNYICLAAELPPEEYGLHQENYPFLDYMQLNQIENACRLIFERLFGIMKARKRLPFKLGKRGTL